jgi:hypothetical protein
MCGPLRPPKHLTEGCKAEAYGDMATRVTHGVKRVVCRLREGMQGEVVKLFLPFLRCEPVQRLIQAQECRVRTIKKTARTKMATVKAKSARAGAGDSKPAIPPRKGMTDQRGGEEQDTVGTPRPKTAKGGDIPNEGGGGGGPFLQESIPKELFEE